MSLWKIHKNSHGVELNHQTSTFSLYLFVPRICFFSPPVYVQYLYSTEAWVGFMLFCQWEQEPFQNCLVLSALFTSAKAVQMRQSHTSNLIHTAPAVSINDSIPQNLQLASLYRNVKKTSTQSTVYRKAGRVVSLPLLSLLFPRRCRFDKSSLLWLFPLLHAKVHVAECDTDTTKGARRCVLVFMYACVHLCGSACFVACSSVCRSLCLRATVCVMSLMQPHCVCTA